MVICFLRKERDLIPNFRSHNFFKKSIGNILNTTISSNVNDSNYGDTGENDVVGVSCVSERIVASPHYWCCLLTRKPSSQPLLLINQLKVPNLRMLSQLGICNNSVILFSGNLTGCYKQREVECVSRLMAKEPLLRQVLFYFTNKNFMTDPILNPRDLTLSV